MSFNIVSAITQLIGPDTIARLAQALGINPTLAQTLVNAAVPSLLGSMGTAAATPAGAQRLSDQVRGQDANVLGGLLNGIGGAEHNDMIGYGYGVLNTVLGGEGVTNTLGSALSRFTGASTDATNSVLSLVAPMALGVIGQQGPAATTPQGLGTLFASQAGAIQSALPQGLASSLGGLLGNFAPGAAIAGAAGAAGAAMSGAAASAANAARSATDTIGASARSVGASMENAAASAANSVRNAEQRVESAAASSGMPGWLLPVVGIILIALAAWYFLGRKEAPKAPAPAPAATTTTAPAAAVEAFTKDANAAFAGLANTLAGITSPDAAKAALPKLTEFDGQVGKLQTSLSAMPETARKTASGSLTGLITAAKAAIEKASAIPGVGDVIKPVTGPILAKLDTLAKG